MFLTIPPKDCARLLVSLAISASGLPSPPKKSCQAELKFPIAPVTVSVLSLAKLPAYCSVLSRNICIARVFFSACVAVFQEKFVKPFSSAYASRFVAFIATPKLSIIVKLPLQAPVMDSIAIVISIPITDATSDALCIALAVMSSASLCSIPEPCKSEPILLAVARNCDCDIPMFL